jgi:hypothetical protein
MGEALIPPQKRRLQMDPYASEAFRLLLVIGALFMVLLLATISAYPLVDWIGRHPHRHRKSELT